MHSCQHVDMSSTGLDLWTCEVWLEHTLDSTSGVPMSIWNHLGNFITDSGSTISQPADRPLCLSQVTATSPMNAFFSRTGWFTQLFEPGPGHHLLSCRCASTATFSHATVRMLPERQETCSCPNPHAAMRARVTSCWDICVRA